MTKPQTLAEVDTFWASWLGCRLEEIASGAVRVAPCSETCHQQIFLFRRGLTCIVSVADPSGGRLIGEVKSIVKDRPVGEVFDDGFWKEQLGGRVQRIVGPAHIGYADESDFQSAASAEARVLDDNDEGELRRLATACEEPEWEHSGIEFARRPVFGCFEGDTLVAAASYEVWGARIAHVGVVTHPAHRGKGFGKSVVAGICRHALGEGLILQYRTLAANAPSVAIARSLGFQEYAETYAIRTGPR